MGVDLEGSNDGSLGEASRQVGPDKFVRVATYSFVCERSSTYEDYYDRLIITTARIR